MALKNLPELFAFSRAHQWQKLVFSLKGYRFWRTQLTMLIGISLNAFVINAIIIPHTLFTGGLTGISLIIYYLSPLLGLGWIYFILNIPLFILAWRKLTLSLIIHSISGMLMTSLMLEVTKGAELQIPEPLVASILAGLFFGLGTGFYLRFGGSAGGLDILAAYMRKSYNLPLGVTFNLTNLLILGSALYFNDLMTTFYAGIFIFCNSWMTEKIVSGFSQRNAVMIITDAPHLIAAEISKRLDRDVTFLHASGGYSKKEKEIIYTVINFTETGRLKEIIYEIDENAFITILNTSAVIGTKFLTWEDEGYTYKRHQAMLQEIEKEKQDLHLD